MNKRIIIVHGWAGSPQDNYWGPWLHQKMENLGYEVISPKMPDAKVPDIEKWVNYLSEVIGIPDENTFLVGHSIGCQTILRYLETINIQIGGILFVAPWFYLNGLSSRSVAIAEQWLEMNIDFKKVQKNIKTPIKALLSSNEPYGFVNENKNILEKELNADVIVLENRGHFAEDDECTELAEVYSFLLKSILETEYPIVYEWQDAPDTIYPEHSHQGKVSFYVVHGSVTFSGGITQTVSENERIDIQPNVLHSAKVGNEGCSYIVGQEIEDDA